MKQSSADGPRDASTDKIRVKRRGYANRQTCSPAVQVLTQEELKRLDCYKHKSDKTPFESFMTGTLATLLERLYPSVFNANFVSLVGQIPLIVVTVYFLMENGFSMKAGDSIKDESLFLYCGIALFWFTTHDLMDGQRARRLQAGSPLGRLIDEAHDTILISCYSVIFVYLLRFDCNVLESIGLFINTLVFTIEVKFILVRELKMDLGWIGGYEIETLLATLFVYSGIYGAGWPQSTLVESFGSSIEEISPKLADVKVNEAIAFVLFPVGSLMHYENLSECFQKNKQRTFDYLKPLLLLIVLYFSHSLLPANAEYRALTHMLFNLALSVITLDLMLANMACKEFAGAFSPAFLLLIVPLVAGLAFDLDAELEMQITLGCTVSAFALFVFNMTVLITQYLEYSGRNFLLRSTTSQVKDKSA